MNRSRKILYSTGLFALFAAGLLLRYAGLTEPFLLHPDEQPISTWMNRMHETGSLLPRVYAGGFFTLADAARKICEWTLAHSFHRWAYFVRATDQFAPSYLNPFGFGRPFNAWLGALAILIAAALARRVTRSRAGALTAAALMAFAAFPIEHAHYLESDIAMLATLTLALALMARALSTRRVFDMALAAFATGFAAGTKFPLASLLVPLLASIRIPPRAAGIRRKIGWTAGLLLLTLLMAAAGFATASPDVLHFSEFGEGLARGAASVYSETSGILGPNAAEPHAREWMNAAIMVRFAKSMRPGWLLLAALGVPLCFSRRIRPFWPVTLLFPALFLWYSVFQAPWIRSQEFMAVLPNFGLWAALPIAALWRAPDAAAKKVLAVLLFCAAVLPVLHSGVAMSSQFAWEDTRRLANRALTLWFPPHASLGVELYAPPAEKQVSSRLVGIGEYEAADPQLFLSNQVDYVLLNTDAHNRGVWDLRTDKPFPKFAERLDALHRQGQRMAAWGPLDSPAPQPTFRAPPLELWHRPSGRIEAQEELGVDLPRPTLVQDEGRTTFYRHDLRAGPRIALLMDKFPREIAIGGPGDLDGPVFLVASTQERAATVRAKGFGQRRRAALGPYDAVAIPMQRPWWNPRWARYERVVLQCEPGAPFLTYLPCFLRVAFDPIEAATLLLDEGHPGKAVDLLRQQNALEKAGPFWQALAGEPGAKQDATALLARWVSLLDLSESPPPPIRTAGMPLAAWQDFARIRLTALDAPTLLYLSLPPETLNAERRTAALAQLLPVFGANQRLALELGRNPDSFGGTHFSGQVFLDADHDATLGAFEANELPDPSMKPLSWSCASTSFPRRILLSFRSRSDGVIAARNAEFSWNWRDMLALRAAQLRRALEQEKSAADAVRYGDWLALRDCRLDGGQISATFEALQDFIPPLAAQVKVLKNSKWRARTTVPLGQPGAAWRAGERRTVHLPMENGFGPDRTGIAIVTDVPFHASLLPMDGAPAKRPFPLLAERLPLP
ncbi:MAG: phospholipid carrier-dependent glycosyltransferase [Opitutae bacterium]|nr:phospholipid carrier-dependent glycosyltransferase [Opitutae bacterium]